MSGSPSEYELPWEAIDTAPRDGSPVLVWNGLHYGWASWRVPVFDASDDESTETWCEDRLAMWPPPTHWLRLTPPRDAP